MQLLKKFFLVATISLLIGCSNEQAAQSCGPKLSIADTPENREAEAARYLAAFDMSRFSSDMISGFGAAIPEPQREEMRERFVALFQSDEMKALQKRYLVKHLTAEELNHYAAFISDPIGKSAIDKVGKMTADMMPELMRMVHGAMLGVKNETPPN